MVEETTQESQPQKRIRSPYLFPAYGIATALQVGQIVESDGGGSLSETALAMAMSSSAKSSTFRLKTLTAKQFGIVTKNGPNLLTTPLAKAIFKPTRDSEKAGALATAFLSIPLFREVAQRYKGQPLPNSGSLRNILERELGIIGKRVPNAERVLMDSARDAGVLRSSGSNTYVAPATDGGAVIEGSPTVPPEPSVGLAGEIPAANDTDRVEPPRQAGQFTLSEEDLALLKDDEFDTFWTGLGKIARRRGQRKLASEEETD